MDFEEKIDAMRMTLELAMHDIEALRARTEALQARTEALQVRMEAHQVNIEAQHANIEDLRLASASQSDSIRELVTISQNLVIAAQSHDQRISGLERRA